MSENNTINIPLTKEEITLIYEMFKDKIFEMSEGYVYWDKYTYDILNSTNNKLEDIILFENLKEQSADRIRGYYGEKFISTKYINTIKEEEYDLVLKFQTRYYSNHGIIHNEYNLVEITPKDDGYEFFII